MENYPICQEKVVISAVLPKFSAKKYIFLQANCVLYRQSKLYKGGGADAKDTAKV